MDFERILFAVIMRILPALAIIAFVIVYFIQKNRTSKELNNNLMGIKKQLEDINKHLQKQ